MKKTVYIIALVISAILLICSGYQIYKHYSEEKEQFRHIDRLTSLIEPTESATNEQTAYDKYAALFRQNPDMVGWIKIDGTTVNYPVMQTPDRPSYYLKHNFEKEYSDLGIPFVSEACDIEKSDNTIIFGHHIRGGKMFGALESYKSKEFYLAYPIIQFDTRFGFGKYEIIAVFPTTPNRFRYDEFTDSASQVDFNEFISKCKSLSFYDTGKMAVYGDKLLTLSTCEYSEKNSRLVVVAKKL